jgi:hypothetical protein
VQTTEIIDPSRGFTRTMMYHSRVEAANLGLHRHELEEAIPGSGEGRSAAAGGEARAGGADPRWIFPYISDLLFHGPAGCAPSSIGLNSGWNERCAMIVGTKALPDRVLLLVNDMVG